MKFRSRSEEEPVTESPTTGGGGKLTPRRWRTGREQTPHSSKFRGAIFLLVALGLAAVVVAVVVSGSGGSSHSSGGDWSSWSPDTSGASGAQEIADYVSPYYRASSADQLAVVTAVNLNDPSNPLQIALSSSGSPGGVQALPSNGTIAYNLCGLNSTDCSIGTGTPSSNRLLLLRREALELALYTFKYIHGVQTVVAILPPGKTTQTSCTGICPKPHTASSTKPLDIALAFDRKELQPWLDRPLRETLPEALPPTVAEMPNAPEAELVSVITAHGLFSESTEQAQDGSNLLVLNPLPPQ
ncbi:MAG TPA: hypothetical protein VGI87_04030 [Solirubrobacteraceae bacterium]